MSEHTAPGGDSAKYARADSEANRSLRRLVDLLGEVREIGEQWAENHGSECDCAYCTNAGVSADDVADDCRGAAWAARMAGDMLRGVSFLPPEDREAAQQEQTREIELKRMLKTQGGLGGELVRAANALFTAIYGRTLAEYGVERFSLVADLPDRSMVVLPLGIQGGGDVSTVVTQQEGPSRG